MENLAQSSPLVRKSKIEPAKRGVNRHPMDQLIRIMIDMINTLYICDTGIGAVKRGRGQGMVNKLKKIFGILGFKL